MKGATTARRQWPARGKKPFFERLVAIAHQSDDEGHCQLSRYKGSVKQHRATPTGVGVRGIIVVYKLTVALSSFSLPERKPEHERGTRYSPRHSARTKKPAIRAAHDGQEHWSRVAQEGGLNNEKRANDIRARKSCRIDRPRSVHAPHADYVNCYHSDRNL